ncbi:uncharacterized protein A4U43_C05F9220 [Asparagus officinalis]|uniref:Uncharacterized protein n=1 Tax=Asparagus officinalis TaxID=4686 RepID=A0A5P1ERF8_ASPOF|nr:uncharacterized protein A4U43_C05F9220 [Asparagus officinalis]
MILTVIKLNHSHSSSTCEYKSSFAGTGKPNPHPPRSRNPTPIPCRRASTTESRTPTNREPSHGGGSAPPRPLRRSAPSLPPPLCLQPGRGCFGRRTDARDCRMLQLRRAFREIFRADVRRTGGIGVGRDGSSRGNILSLVGAAHPLPRTSHDAGRPPSGGIGAALVPVRGPGGQAAGRDGG